MQNGLAAHIRKYVDLTEDEASLLGSHVKTQELKKKSFLLKEGQVCKANYFVERGCLRLFFTDEKGAEQTQQFAIENWWITDYVSLGSRLPSQFCIQAVENSTVIAFDKASQDDVFVKLPQLNRYFRQVLEIASGATQWRIRYMFSFSKEEIYWHFCQSFPEFVQRVPQYMLASFLGLTPEYVSELRKKKG